MFLREVLGVVASLAGDVLLPGDVQASTEYGSLAKAHVAKGRKVATAIRPTAALGSFALALVRKNPKVAVAFALAGRSQRVDATLPVRLEAEGDDQMTSRALRHVPKVVGRSSAVRP